MKIITWNVKHQSANKILNEIAGLNADAIFLQECDFTFPRTFLNTTKTISKYLGLKKFDVTQDKNSNFWFGRTGISTLVKNSETKFEVYEFDNQKKHFRKALINDFYIDNKLLKISNVHLQSGYPDVAKAQLTELINNVNSDLIIGDFNLNYQNITKIIESTDYKICFKKNSFKASKPTKQLDFILCKLDYRAHSLKTISNSYSDHLGFCIDMFLT